MGGIKPTDLHPLSKGQKIALVAGLAHLMFLTLSGTGVINPHAWRQSAHSAVGAVKSGLIWYSRMTGADNRYDIMTGSLPPPYRVDFTAVDDQGRNIPMNWIRGDETPEAKTRLSTWEVRQVVSTDILGRLEIAHLWSMALLNSNPSFKQVDFSLKIKDFPTIQQAEKRIDPEWRVLQNASFPRSK